MAQSFLTTAVYFNASTVYFNGSIVYFNGSAVFLNAVFIYFISVVYFDVFSVYFITSVVYLVVTVYLKPSKPRSTDGYEIEMDFTCWLENLWQLIFIRLMIAKNEFVPQTFGLSERSICMRLSRLHYIHGWRRRLTNHKTIKSVRM